MSRTTIRASGGYDIVFISTWQAKRQYCNQHCYFLRKKTSWNITNVVLHKLFFILFFIEKSTPSVLNYKQKKLIFFVPNYKQKKTNNYLFQRKIKCKVHSICSLFHFLNNQQPMKIVFTSSYKTYFKNNTKNYVTNYYVLVFLISVIFFFL